MPAKQRTRGKPSESKPVAPGLPGKGPVPATTTTAEAPKPGKPLTPTPMKRTPSREEMLTIVTAVRYLIRTASETWCITGEPAPAGFPKTRRGDMYLAIQSLERLLNPQMIPFGANERQSVNVGGWSDVMRVGRALEWLRNLHDSIIQAWRLEPRCEGRPFMTINEDAGVPAEIAKQYAIIRVPKDSPPTIDRPVLDGMATVVSWMEDEIRQADAQDEARDAAAKVDAERKSGGSESDGAGKGVTMRQLAQILEEDPDTRPQLLRKWNKSRVRKPESLGKDPGDGRANLYEPTAIVEWMKKVEAYLTVPEELLLARLAVLAREPAKK